MAVVMFWLAMVVAVAVFIAHTNRTARAKWDRDTAALDREIAETKARIAALDAERAALRA